MKFIALATIVGLATAAGDWEMCNRNSDCLVAGSKCCPASE